MSDFTILREQMVDHQIAARQDLPGFPVRQLANPAVARVARSFRSRLLF